MCSLMLLLFVVVVIVSGDGVQVVVFDELESTKCVVFIEGSHTVGISNGRNSERWKVSVGCHERILRADTYIIDAASFGQCHRRTYIGFLYIDPIRRTEIVVFDNIVTRV